MVLWLWLLVGADVLCALRSPRVGVVVVTFDRPRYLERCLANIASQDYPRELTEVIVIDDTPDDAARAAVEASTGRALACTRYVHLAERATIGAKRSLGARLAAEDLGCDVVATWDDDDVYGADRLSLQISPIAAGDADATVATPRAWRYEYEAAGERPAEMTWFGPVLGTVLAAVDADCALGTFILDEAIASLCFRAALHGGDADYPDASYDEDRAFVRALMTSGARLARLPPDAPDYVHVKHAEAAARGPLTDLYAAGLGAFNSPLAAVAAVAAATASLRAALPPHWHPP